MARIANICISAALICSMLTACGSESEPAPAVERVAFADLRRTAETPLPSPDTAGALWSVTEDGQAIHFGQQGEPPLLTLGCSLRDDPPRLTLIRHVPAQPGQKALLPVIGNGMISRFKVDAALVDGEWRWEGSLPAADPMLDVFTGQRELEATLPGGGTLRIGASRIPGEFLRWCRARGRLQQAVAEETPAGEGDATSAAPE